MKPISQSKLNGRQAEINEQPLRINYGNRTPRFFTHALMLRTSRAWHTKVGRLRLE